MELTAPQQYAVGDCAWLYPAHPDQADVVLPRFHERFYTDQSQGPQRVLGFVVTVVGTRWCRTGDQWTQEVDVYPAGRTDNVVPPARYSSSWLLPIVTVPSLSLRAGGVRFVSGMPDEAVLAIAMALGFTWPTHKGTRFPLPMAGAASILRATMAAHTTLMLERFDLIGRSGSVRRTTNWAVACGLPLEWLTQ